MLDDDAVASILEFDGSLTTPLDPWLKSLWSPKEKAASAFWLQETCVDVLHQMAAALLRLPLQGRGRGTAVPPSQN